jgi:hypothetical protein
MTERSKPTRDHEIRRARQRELHRVLRSRYDAGLSALDDADLADQ